MKTKLLSLLILHASLQGANYVVSTPGDPNPTTGGSGTSLRAVLNAINQSTSGGDTITFNLGINNTINLGGMLPLLNLTTNTNNLVIDGTNGGNQIVIDGGGTFRGFYARQGNVEIENMAINNVFAAGGNGGNGEQPGGGGLGAGAALFIDSAHVTLSNVTMTTHTVKGGNTGAPISPASSQGGGGGMGGNGGAAIGFASASGGGLGGNGNAGGGEIGGGGIGPGGDGGSNPGGGFGGASAGSGTSVGGPNGGGGGNGGSIGAGGGGDGGSDGTVGTNGTIGGNGGYGGGGGTGSELEGNGGFGGGGAGAQQTYEAAGSGGFGGGGGGSVGGPASNGGFGGGGGKGYPNGTGGVGAGNPAGGLAGAGAAMGGAIFVNTGSLDVTGLLTVSGGSTIAGTGGTGAGAAVSTGIFAIGAGPLTFNNSAGSSNLITINDSIGDDSRQTLHGGTYNPGTGPGAGILKQGTGTLIFNGVNTYFGLTDVANGIFIDHGTIPGNTLVEQLGTLLFSGTSTVGYVQNNGNVTPEDITQVFHIGGNYVQSSTGTYTVIIDNALHNSLLTAHGTATLSGTLSVDGPLSGRPLNTEYLILHADGGVSQQFEHAVDNGPYADTLRYDGFNVYLSFRSRLPILGLTPNQMQVANQLNNVTILDPDLQNILTILSGLPQSELDDALDAMAGEQYTYLMQIDKYGNERFNNRVFTSVRNWLTPCGCDCIPSCGTQTWMQLEGGQVFSRKNVNTPGITTRNIDISLGALTLLTSKFLLGGAFNYQQDRVNFHQGGNTNWNTAQAALYGAYTDSTIYLFGDLIFGTSSARLKRHITFSTIDRQAESHPNIIDTMFYGECGFDVGVPCVTLQPFIAYQCGYYHLHGTYEKGADSLNLFIHKRHVNASDILAGSHLTTCTDAYRFSLDLAWQHRFNSSLNQVTNEFRQFGTRFPILGTLYGKDGLKGRLYASVDLDPCVTLYANLTGEGWRNWSTYGVDVGISTKW